MLVQYLVGLCCLRWDPNAVDVTLGNMVLDPTAGKKRDVDVTVTVAEAPNTLRAFKAYEVKDEKAPLDVAAVEQLCIKLLDMPEVTHRAIVSASGFTDGAERKAAHHGVELYTIGPWTRLIQEQFPVFGMQGIPQDCFETTQALLVWSQYKLRIDAPAATQGSTARLKDKLFGKDSMPHSKFADLKAYVQEALQRSTEILVSSMPPDSLPANTDLNGEAGSDIGPAWPHEHTIDASPDGVFLKTAEKLVSIKSLTIEGQLQWRRGNSPNYYVIERVPSKEVFAGAIIASDIREGSMQGLVFSPKTRTIGIHLVRLAEKHQKVIRELKLELAEPR